MTRIGIQLPEGLASEAKALAAANRLTLDQFVAQAVAEKTSATMAEAALEEGAKGGDKTKFLAALAKIRGGEPIEEDRL